MTHLADLVSGYRRFRANGWSRERERWAELAQGQDPRVLVIACADSRVDPTRIFDTAPGEIFVVRNIANLVPPYETDPGHHGVSAALEYAVTIIEVDEIVVIGHGGCGGVRASLARADGGRASSGGFIDGWIDLLDDARDRVRERCGGSPDVVRELEQEAVKVSLANLRTFPFVAEREAAGRLALHGAYFAVADGLLHLLDPESGRFAPVAA